MKGGGWAGLPDFCRVRIARQKIESLRLAAIIRVGPRVYRRLQKNRVAREMGRGAHPAKPLFKTRPSALSIQNAAAKGRAALGGYLKRRPEPGPPLCVYGPAFADFPSEECYQK